MSVIHNALAAIGVSIVASSSAVAQATSGTWDTNLSGDWTDVLNWLGDTAYAEGADNTATFGNFITADTVINLDTSITIGNITASDATHTYTISGTSVLTLDKTTGVPVIDVTTSGRTLVISSQISGTDGLQKNGAGILRLTGTNDFTGGITIAEGRLIAGSDAALGATSNGITFTGTQGALLLPTGSFTLDSNRTITSQTGAMAVISRENINNNGTINIGGKLTGEGGFQFSTGYQLGSVIFNLSNANNDFQGALRIGGDYTGVHTFTPSTVTLNMASLTDGSGYGNIQFGRGNNSSGNTLTLNYTNAAAADLVLDNRRIELGSSAETAHLSNSSTTYGIIVNTDLLVSRAGNKTLRLSAVSGSDNNVFAGDIADGTNAVIAIEKSSSGTWALGGTNTYSGRTTLAQANPAAGGITFHGMQAVSENTELYQRHGGGTGGHGTWKFLDDSATPVSRSMVDILHVQRNGSQNALNIFVGNNSTANGGTSASTQTGSTIQLGNLTFQQEATGATGGARLNLTGANDYGLQLGNVNVELQAAYTGTWNVRLDAISAGLTVGGNVQQAAGSLGTTNLQLDGDVNGNVISGNILDSADVTPQSLAVTKEGVNTWTLSGANTYTGNTTISGGTLEIGGSGTLGNSSAGVGNYAGNIAIASTNSGRLVYNSTATQTLSGVISGAGALVKNNSGNLILTNTNSLTGATTINAGILSVNGTGAINSSAVTINGGDFRYNSSTNYTNTLTFTSGSISGTNWGGSLDNLVIASNQTISPGNSPGTATTGAQTWAAGGTYLWEINNATGTAGTDPGWDLLSGTGILTISATAGSEFIIDVTSLDLTNLTGDAANFDQNQNYTWLIAQFDSISGFDETDFVINADDFTNATNGSFGISLGGTELGTGTNNEIYLTYTTNQVIPEPKAALLGALGILLLLRRRR